MGQEETKTEKKVMRIVDGFVTVEIVRREKQLSRKRKVRKPLGILKGKNGRTERRAPPDDKGQTG